MEIDACLGQIREKQGQCCQAEHRSCSHGSELIRLEELKPNAAVRGLLPDCLVTDHREPDFGVTSVNYDFTELIAQSRVPCRDA